MEKEKRIYDKREFRVGTAGNGDEKAIEGHAAVFNEYTQIGDSFIEVIEPGAFDSCDLSDVALLVNHDNQSLPLARTQSGTMTVWIDKIGLAFKAKLDVSNNPAAKMLYSSVARGDVKGMSFAFIVEQDDWQNLDSDLPTRHIRKIKKIYELSAATFPAYEGTDVNARAAKRTADEDAAELQSLKKEIKERYGLATEKKKFDWKEAGEAFKEKSFSRRFQSPYNIFGERRTMTVEPSSSGESSIIVPTYSSANINPDFSVVSSLIDSVAHLSLNGGESFLQPYVTGIDLGGYTGEAENAAEAETAFSSAQINRCKITAYCELSEELSKLPAANYADVVFQNIKTSIQGFLTKEILFGEGVSNGGFSNRLVGIFSEKATAIASDTDFSISQITDITLDEILIRYGGDESVEAIPCCLILHKLDLLAFAKVRTSTREKFYDIKFSTSNTGTISGVPFILSSALKPLSMTADKGGAQSGDYVMCYGNPKSYLLTEFSPLEVTRSNDFKFRSGVSCFRGSVFCGGNVCKKNGFIRIRRQ